MIDGGKLLLLPARPQIKVTYSWLTAHAGHAHPHPRPAPPGTGFTWTHAPLPGSPAIDAGKNFSGSATDQRGAARTIDYSGVPNAPDGDGTDIGAVEVQ